VVAAPACTFCRTSAPLPFSMDWWRGQTWSRHQWVPGLLLAGPAGVELLELLHGGGDLLVDIGQRLGRRLALEDHRVDRVAHLRVEQGHLRRRDRPHPMAGP